MSRLSTDAQTTECEDKARILGTEFAKNIRARCPVCTRHWYKSQVPRFHTVLGSHVDVQGPNNNFFRQKTWNIITVQCTPRHTQIYFISPLHCSVLLLTVKGQKLALTFCSSKCLKINNLYRLGKNKFQYHITYFMHLFNIMSFDIWARLYLFMLVWFRISQFCTVYSFAIREDIKTRKTFEFERCPNLGGGLPLPEFFCTVFILK